MSLSHNQACVRLLWSQREKRMKCVYVYPHKQTLHKIYALLIHLVNVRAKSFVWSVDKWHIKILLISSDALGENKHLLISPKLWPPNLKWAWRKEARPMLTKPDPSWRTKRRKSGFLVKWKSSRRKHTNKRLSYKENPCPYAHRIPLLWARV